VLLAIGLVACGHEVGAGEDGSGGRGGVGGSAASGDGGAGGGEPASSCAPASNGQAPQSIDQVVEALNAMAKPVDLPCFLRHLPGTLTIAASVSQLSAQPASSRMSPRIFIFEGPLVLSVVPEGTGRDLLEMGEVREEGRSLKGEIAFPVTSALAPDAPYAHALYNEMYTSCAFCHAQEERDPSIAASLAFISRALQPDAFSLVNVDVLVEEAGRCDGTLEPYRCAMLGALFGRSHVTQGVFPATFGYFP